VPRWYLIHTKPASEVAARVNLERQGYEVYLPRLLQSLRQRGHWKERIAALFPRYLFLRLHEGLQALAPVRSTVGVSDVVRFGSSYATVPDCVIRQLQSRADPRSGLHIQQRCRSLAAGDAVFIEAGPFGGIEGIFECESGSERVVILMKLLGREIPIRVPVALVLPGHPA
jgi:transcriptional antiterminator RfaH